MLERPLHQRAAARRPIRSAGALACACLALVVVPSQAAAPTSAGQLYGYGSNIYGELGSSTNNGTTNGLPPTLVALPGATGPVTQVASGAVHSLALTATDQLYAFGANSSGELGNAVGNGSPTPYPTPALVSLPGETGNVTQIAAGNYDSFAVTSSGQLYAFGDNQYGQLGNATHNAANLANPIPAPVVLPGATGGVVRVAAGGAHTLALTSTGQLYAFGINLAGELGSATNSGSASANPTPAPVTLPGATGVVAQIAAGGSHSLALTSTGQLYAFGDNTYGQLGSTVGNGAPSPNPTPALVSLPGATGAITQISAGAYHSLALTSTGQLYAFGGNFEGQLGTAINLGTNAANPTPLQVSLPGATGAVIRIAAGGL